MGELIRILLADDHPHGREGMRDIIALEPAFTIVGEVDSGEGAAEAARQLFDRGSRANRGYAIAHAGGAFLRAFLWRLGVLDGVTGLRVGWYVSAYTYRKWALVAVLTKQAAKSGR